MHASQEIKARPSSPVETLPCVQHRSQVAYGADQDSIEWRLDISIVRIIPIARFVSGSKDDEPNRNVVSVAMNPSPYAS